MAIAERGDHVLAPDVVAGGEVGDRPCQAQGAVAAARAELAAAIGVDERALHVLGHADVAAQEARADGYDEALLLDASGFVSEGAGENLFMIKKGIVYTPDLSAGALDGITRNTILAICADLGLKLVEKRITRDEVYICDEAFFTGTAAEVTPIRELDRIELGSGARGPITERIQSAFFDIVNGRNAKYAEWLTKV